MTERALMLIPDRETHHDSGSAHYELTAAGRRRFGEIIHIKLGEAGGATEPVPEPVTERLPLRSRLEHIGITAIHRFMKELST